MPFCRIASFFLRIGAGLSLSFSIRMSLMCVFGAVSDVGIEGDSGGGAEGSLKVDYSTRPIRTTKLMEICQNGFKGLS
ncbi:hypothetical protein B0T24DRAFT_632624 [Lasiosphaeria ovina]|uniref:Secreted protein n=1 Tax=Lasiosphaeria ovina TaxID=92902 RepID=A0AAE0N422_9PEZI|nr:hypothetical protein B0T24DRAFT_632624 [Lasiosphaeria ovina]